MKVACAVVLLSLNALTMNAQPARVALEEASGITRAGDHLLIVSDGTPGTYFWYRLDNNTCPPQQQACVITIDPARLQRVEIPGGAFARDLEGIGILGDGRVAMLSERLRALVGEAGVIAEYSEQVAEFGERGLEGLAIAPQDDGSSRVAALWEGGYLQLGEVHPRISERVGPRAVRPLVVVHQLAAGASGEEVDAGRASIDLDVPMLEGAEPVAQRFRATDLVWHEWLDGDALQSGFIVMLSSQSSTDPVVYEHQWLRRFDRQGKALPGTLDLGTVLPDGLGKANWEGLGWFVPGESLVLIHDKPPKGMPKIAVVTLPEAWRGTAGETMLVTQETSYYRSGPQQGRPPEGSLRRGDVVRLIRNSGSYSQVVVDGGTAHVSSGALWHPHRGAAGDGAKFVKIADGAVTADWAYSDGPGWLAFHLDEGTGSPGTLIGVAPLKPGWNQRVMVPVSLRKQSKVWGVYYADRGKVGVFEPADASRWTGPAMCDAADAPGICHDRLLARVRLVEACAGMSSRDCREGLPVGVFMVTANP